VLDEVQRLIAAPAVRSAGQHDALISGTRGGSNSPPVPYDYCNNRKRGRVALMMQTVVTYPATQ
jgi:hypothetical protein